MPTYEELGINLEAILLDGNSSQSGESSNGYSGHAATGTGGGIYVQPQASGETKATAAPLVEYQSAKLKNSAYKKLRERVRTTKVMWFNGPPERRPTSVVFECSGLEMSHHTIVERVNESLKRVHGYVVSVEFVPRSVHFGSVYVENLWILTLNDMNTKFYTMTNGVQIKDDEKIAVKSYDDFIFQEYERFIRTEKYKQLIRNHEKAVQSSLHPNRKSKFIS